MQLTILQSMSYASCTLYAAIGEEFGHLLEQELLARCLLPSRLGADKVYDTNFGADLTIMEEGTELINRSKWWRASNDYFMFCDGYVQNSISLSSYLIYQHASPHEMEGAILRLSTLRRMA